MNLGKTGLKGEASAARFLKSKGYRIISRNYQTRYGELDIVCRNDSYIVFAEVKTRSENYIVSGVDAVNLAKQKRIVKAALQFLQENSYDLQPRFDVLEIVIVGDGETVTHIENAFSATDYHGFY